MIVLATEKVNCPFCSMPMHFYHEDIYRKYYYCLECAGRQLRGKKRRMRKNFSKAFELTVGLEGKYSNDLNDPGGETKYGIAKRYHPNEDIKNLTLDRAKEIYLNEYWIPSHCDEADYPMDIILFDSSVNPQKGGNKDLLSKGPENWQELLIWRMVRYMKLSKDIYVKGHLFRVLRLFEKIKESKEA